ncbi:hypothetical protein PHLGIDRAFT_140355 [Phlebiopsis gigantea 11061_1 CR5-6]|uniref:CENP-V/GFA domain-containing protein n=1 Tax=Phlebiopsis gigantea (strain 11061_1 CR5-6) TaxID=745531 RepID=A0A0C3SCW3_PHLG1|nr:hypothetical protein PHLGIDRAFT_140355 [Phlebiopsis gigantea 11061_1 CR5-6]
MTGTAATLEVPSDWPKDVEIKEYKGGCHCARFRFKFSHPAFENGEVKVMSCNCSICTQHGLLHIYTPESRFALTTGNIRELSVYQLPGKNTTHHFCPSCGSNIIVRNNEFREIVVNL